MAVAFDATYSGDGATIENYRKILSSMSVSPGGKHPGNGCLFHWATEIPGGFRVTDVWESREQFDEFLQRLGPTADAAGVPEPEIEFFEVANYLTAA
jgi:hypothetical protein